MYARRCTCICTCKACEGVLTTPFLMPVLMASQLRIQLEPGSLQMLCEPEACLGLAVTGMLVNSQPERHEAGWYTPMTSSVSAKVANIA